MTTISLLPLDVGFDLKMQQMEIELPRETWLRIKYIDSAGFKRDDEVSYAQARHILRRAGYRLSDRRKKKEARV